MLNLSILLPSGATSLLQPQQDLIEGIDNLSEHQGEDDK
jgi:hypothetical protein